MVTIKYSCGHYGLVSEPPPRCDHCADAEIARLTAELAAVRALMDSYNLGGWTDAEAPMKRALQAEAELAAAKDELRSKDANYTPLLDSYAANCQRLSDALEASQERERVLRDAIEKAPHGRLCGVIGAHGWDAKHCDCWKRDALGEP